MAAVVVAALLWGTTGTVASFIPDDVGPVAVGAATMGVGGLLLAIAGGRGVLAVLSARGARGWLSVGALGVVVYPLAFYTGMDLAGVAIGNVVALGTGPVVAALLERVFDGTRLSGRWAIATALSIAGVVVHASSRHPGEGGAPVVGVLLALLAGITYGLYTYASGKVIASGAGARGVVGAIFGLASLVLIPVLVATGALTRIDGASLAALGYLAIGPMFVAYLLIGLALVRLRASTVTTIALLEPVAATVLAVVIVGERLTWAGWLGICAILAGIVVLVAARPPRNRVAPPLDSEP